MAGSNVWFASPGDPATLTGGYLYNRRIRQGLTRAGWTVRSIRLPDRFPWPEPSDHTAAAKMLASVPPDDLLVIDGLALGAMTAEVLRVLGARIVALVHHPLADETGLNAARVAVVAESERVALGFARGVIVTSPHTRQALAARYNVAAEKIAVAIPGVDRPVVPPAPVTPPMILSVGSLTVRKGHDVLLEALAEIRDLDWTAILAGSANRDPAAASQLDALRERLGLQQRLGFMGECSPEQLAAFYLKATIFALATRHEGYGMVFSEAMVHGLPIVSCTVGAVPDTVPERAGILVPPDDAEAFAGALRRLLTDDAFYRRHAAGSLAAGRGLPTWEDTARLFGDKLREVGAA